MSLQDQKSIYVNRELSWLSFNERVLESAEDRRLPLFERMRFLSIYGSNLDEFFMVRVGSLYDALLVTPDECDTKTGMRVEEQIQAIYERTQALQPRVEGCYVEIVEALKQENFHQVDINNLSPYEELILSQYFQKNIQPFLAPQIIDKHHPFPYLSNKEQFIGLRFETDNDQPSFGVIPLTSHHFPRYFSFPEEFGQGRSFVMMEPLIYLFANKLFKKKKVAEKFIFRITRNGDLKVEEALYDEDIDWRSQMEQIINKRKRSVAVRLQLSQPISDKMKAYLLKKLELDEAAIVIGGQLPLSLNFIYGLLGEVEQEYPALNYEPMPALMPPGINPGDSVFGHLNHGEDIFLYYPFHAMKTFLDLLDEAAVHEDVTSIKITLYRIASGSKVAQALIKAAENGKDVLVLVELKARFDEEHNIVWSKRLEEAGCTVIYGMGNYKVHSKLCLITKRSGRDVEYITQIGTGNYNEKTARQYTDCSLITKDQKIALEALRVFEGLQTGHFVEHTEYLLVAPLQMQSRILEMMDKEIALAKQGEPARITIKANGFSFKPAIDKVVEASQAGVKVELYIRGICCLKAGVPGYTESVTIKSMVGRFLEHPRIYRFGYGDREKIYISSADLMTRNLKYRVEVGVEILSPKVKRILRDVLDIFAQDNMLARVMQADGSYVRLYPQEGERPIDSQMELYDYFKQLSRESKTTVNEEKRVAKKGLWKRIKALFHKNKS